jgi:hypothetical protein
MAPSPTRVRPLAVVLALALGLLVAACGDDGPNMPMLSGGSFAEVTADDGGVRIDATAGWALTSGSTVPVEVSNTRSEPVDVFFVDDDGNETEMVTVEPGTTQVEVTFPSAGSWVASGEPEFVDRSGAHRGSGGFPITVTD